MSRPLSYVSRNAVHRHLDFASRYRLAARCPSIRTADRRLPFTFSKVKITRSGTIRFNWVVKIKIRETADGKVAIILEKQWIGQPATCHWFIVDGRQEEVVEFLIKYWLDRPGTVFNDHLMVENMRWIRDFRNSPMCMNILKIRSLRFVDDMFLVEARQYHLDGCHEKTATEYLDRLIDKLLSTTFSFETLFYISSQIHIPDVQLLLEKIRRFNPKNSMYTTYEFHEYLAVDRKIESCLRIELGHQDVLIFVDYVPGWAKIRLMVVESGSADGVVWAPRERIVCKQ